MLNSKDSILIKIIASGKQTKIWIDARIIGVSKIGKARKSNILRNTHIVLFSIIGIMGLIGLITENEGLFIVSLILTITTLLEINYFTHSFEIVYSQSLDKFIKE